MQNSSHSIRWKNTLIDFSIPKVMGIVNCTPDSFYKSSRVTPQSLPNIISDMVENGADFLDIGGFSSRPGADLVSVQEELDRILPAIEWSVSEFPNIPISVDTMRSEVVAKLKDYPICIINDISGGTFDNNMIPTVAELNFAYGIMHMQGLPKTMQVNPQYEQDIVAEIIQFLQSQIQVSIDAGIHDVIIDPGFGFGKTLQHNYTILSRLSEFSILNCPLLIGISRKSMLRDLLQISTEEALNASTVAHAFALERGANIIRTHDVIEAKQAVQIYQAIQQTELL